MVKNDNKRHPNVMRNNTFYFPSCTNPRMSSRSYWLNYNNYNGLGANTTSNWNYWSKGQVPALVKGSQDPLFGHKKDYILLRTNQYFAYILNECPTFNTDKFYDMYAFGHLSADVNTNTTCIAECLGSSFHVYEDDVDIRLDLDFTYKNLLWNVYGHGPGYSSYFNQTYNDFGKSHPCFVLFNTETREVYYTKYLDDCTSTTLNIREQISLPAGSYAFVLHIRQSYYAGYQNLVLSFKDVNFNIVTSDLSKIKIVENNFDVLTLFDNEDHYVSGPSEPFIESRGKNTVLKQTSDLTKTYKFNKIKL